MSRVRRKYRDSCRFLIPLPEYSWWTSYARQRCPSPLLHFQTSPNDIERSCGLALASDHESKGFYSHPEPYSKAIRADNCQPLVVGCKTWLQCLLRRKQLRYRKMCEKIRHWSDTLLSPAQGPKVTQNMGPFKRRILKDFSTVRPARPKAQKGYRQFDSCFLLGDACLSFPPTVLR